MAFCGKCGAPVPDGAAFCQRCGQPVAAPQAPAPAARPIAAQGEAARQAGAPTGIGLPPAIAAILTPMGLFPLAATIVCWFCWFELPGASVSLSVSQLPAATISATFWQALGFDPTNMTNTNFGSAGIVGVLIVLCLLAPFAVPFIANKSARLLYAAPLLAFIINVATVEHLFSAFHQFLTTQYFNMADQGVIANTSLGIGAYLAGLASLGAAYGVVTSSTNPKLANLVASVLRPARAAAPNTPPAHVAPPPPHAPVPPAAPPIVAPPVAPVVAQSADFCPKCGRPRAAGAKFCDGCGARFAPISEW